MPPADDPPIHPLPAMEDAMQGGAKAAPSVRRGDFPPLRWLDVMVITLKRTMAAMQHNIHTGGHVVKSVPVSRRYPRESDQISLIPPE